MNRFILALLIMPSLLFGQQAAEAAAAIEKQEQSLLAEWAQQLDQGKEQLDSLNDQLQKLNEIKDIAGDPLGALEKIGLGEAANIAPDGTGVFLSSLGETAGSLSNLKGTAQGLYEDIPTAIGDINIDRDLDKYKKFSSVEEAYNQYSDKLDSVGTKLESLRNERDTTLKTQASTEAEQREKQAKLQALNGEIASLEKEAQRTKEQMEAQHLLNENQEAKERQSAAENSVEITKQINQNRKIIDPFEALGDGIELE